MDRPDLEKLRKFVKEHSFPTDLLVEVVTQCNLNCIMCPQSSLTREKGKMSFALWKKIIDEVAHKSPGTRIWPALMGEPLLLGPEIFKMIKYATEAGVNGIHLNSNLALFNEKMLDDFFTCGLSELVVGLDGATAETYENIRKGSNFDRVMQNIHLILAEKEKRGLDSPRMVLQFIVMDENEHEIDTFVNYWKRSGRTVSLKIKPRTGWADAVTPWDGIMNVSQQDREFPCTWLLRQMTIFWNGKVPQCDGDWNGNTCFGDVSNESIEEIWLGELKKIRDRHLDKDFAFSPCNKCEDWQAGMSKWIECGE